MGMTESSTARTFLWYPAGVLDEALEFYAELFSELTVNSINRQTEDGPIFIAEFSIGSQQFVAMSTEGGPKFNDSVSIAVTCDGQAEVDRLWEMITDKGEPGRCGWCKDQWGLSWQITPRQMHDWLGHSDSEVSAYAWQALMKMDKIIIDDLHR